MTIRVGVTLPTLRDSPEPAFDVARVADASGVDGVFVFDHLFRVGPGGEDRPALELLTVLGAIAAGRLAF